MAGIQGRTGSHCPPDGKMLYIQPGYLSPCPLPVLLKIYKVTWPSWSSSPRPDVMQSDSPVSCCQAGAWMRAARLLLGAGWAGDGQLCLSPPVARGRPLGPRSCKLLQDGRRTSLQEKLPPPSPVPTCLPHLAALAPKLATELA